MRKISLCNFLPMAVFDLVWTDLHECSEVLPLANEMNIKLLMYIMYLLGPPLSVHSIEICDTWSCQPILYEGITLPSWNPYQWCTFNLAISGTCSIVVMALEENRLRTGTCTIGLLLLLYFTYLLGGYWTFNIWESGLSTEVNSAKWNPYNEVLKWDRKSVV